MAEIKPYSFESVRSSSESEEDDVHESPDAQINSTGVRLQYSSRAEKYFSIIVWSLNILKIYYIS